MSLGEDRVRVKFNPSTTGLVDQIKQKTAELIDLCATIEVSALPNAYEQSRLISEAQTRYEDACHWAVKAATTGK